MPPAPPTAKVAPCSSATSGDLPPKRMKRKEDQRRSEFAIWKSSDHFISDDCSGPAGVLLFHLEIGHSLVAADSNGLSDPFCVVKVAENPLWRSRVVKRDLNPVWDEIHSFEGYLLDFTSQGVKLRVYDHDVMSYNDFIGCCEVPLKGLTLGRKGSLVFQNVPLEGVPSGKISFSVRFELKPVFSLFPGTPLHASAAQALRRRPPKDATRAELGRDAVLRFLSHKYFAYAAVAWLCTLVSWIIWIVIVHIGILLPTLVNGGEVEDARYPPLRWDDADLHFHANICFHWTTGLGTYLNTVTLPWRLSIALHLWAGGCLSGRSSGPGEDFYGRATEAIWFHIPRRPRGVVTACLLASTLSHYTMQARDLAQSPRTIP